MRKPRRRGRAATSLGLALSLAAWVFALPANAVVADASCAFDDVTGALTVEGPADNQLFLARDLAGDVTVTLYDWEIGELVTLSCEGGDEANPATSVEVVEAGEESYTDVAIYLEHWEDVPVAITDPAGDPEEDFDYLILIGSDASETIDGADPGFDLTADSITGYTVDGAGGDDEVFGGTPEGVNLVDGEMGAYVVLSGGEGDDDIRGSAEGEYLDGGPGNDLLDGGDGDDLLDGGYGGRARPDRGRGDVYGNGWVAAYRGANDGADVLDGGAGDDVLTYGGGFDLLDGGADFDSCDGYAGTTKGTGDYAKVDYRACEPPSVICTYDGEDTVVVDTLGSVSLNVMRDEAGEVQIVIGTGWEYTDAFTYVTGPGIPCDGGGTSNPAHHVIVNGGGSEASFNTYTDVYVDIANWDETTSLAINDLLPSAAFDYDFLGLVGSDASEVLDPRDFGGTIAAPDVSCLLLFGMGGDDTLTYAVPDGVDLRFPDCGFLHGGSGDDTLQAWENTGTGSDAVLFGGEGDDTLNGADGDFHVYEGGPGADAIFAGADLDGYALGGDGDDVIHVADGGGFSYADGGAGNDTIYGGDTVYFSDFYGGDGDDVLFAGDSDDNFLQGDAGNDVLHGGEGVDFLDGWFGDDVLYGGGGSDVLLYGGRYSRNGSIANGGRDLLDGGDADDACQGYVGATRGTRTFSRVTYEDCESGFEG
ncbi:MAG: calcium-binding protein [Actinomycetota bacterium]